MDMDNITAMKYLDDLIKYYIEMLPFTYTLKKVNKRCV